MAAEVGGARDGARTRRGRRAKMQRGRDRRGGNEGGRVMERGRGEDGDRRCGEDAIGARGRKVAARAMERGRGEGGERRCGEGAIGARGTKVVARAMEQRRGESGERRSGEGTIGMRKKKWRRGGAREQRRAGVGEDAWAGGRRSHLE